MLDRGSIAAIALAAALTLPAASAQAHDESKYPDWSGQWIRTYGGNPRYDQSKPLRKQEAPLKPEYQKMFEASIAAQDVGGHGLDRAYTCLPQGMPRMMSGVSLMEFLFSPSVTHMLFEQLTLALQAGYEVLTRHHGYAALQALQAETVDVLLTDMLLPGCRSSSRTTASCGSLSARKSSSTRHARMRLE